MLNCDVYVFFVDFLALLALITAGVLISCTVGLRHNVCCQGPVLIPRQDSETSAQTTRVNVPDFFVKPKNRISAFYTKRRYIDKNTNKNTQKIRF